MTDLALQPHTSFLLVIDVQERLVAAMPEEVAQAVRRTERLLEGAQALGIPVLVTEQYPRGLGPTVATVAEKARSANAIVIEKLEFDASANEAVHGHLERLRAEGRTTALVCGLEAHICVYQSVRGLVQQGFRVHIASDAVCSRERANQDLARGLYHYAGGIPSSSEVMLFDLVGKAGSDAFKTISKLVR